MTHKHAHLSLHTHTHAHTHSHTHTHTRTHTRTHNTHTHTHTHTHARTHTHTHSYYVHIKIIILTHTHTHTHTFLSVDNLERGEHIFRQKGNVVVAVWKDKKPIHLMSSNCSPTGDTQVRRKQKDGRIRFFPCPPSLVAYNSYMAGVDKADQLRGYYKVRSKSRKFHKYIFWFLFDTCVVNTFILMKKFCPATDNTPTEALKSFRVRLAEQLIGDYNSRQRYALQLHEHIPGGPLSHQGS